MLLVKRREGRRIISYYSISNSLIPTVKIRFKKERMEKRRRISLYSTLVISICLVFLHRERIVAGRGRLFIPTVIKPGYLEVNS